MGKMTFEFSVGDTVILCGGNRRYVRTINGIRGGYLKVGSMSFDWTGREVDVLYGGYRIEPIKNNENFENEC